MRLPWLERLLRLGQGALPTFTAPVTGPAECLSHYCAMQSEAGALLAAQWLWAEISVIRSSQRRLALSGLLREALRRHDPTRTAWQISKTLTKLGLQEKTQLIVCRMLLRALADLGAAPSDELAAELLVDSASTSEAETHEDTWCDDVYMVR